MTPSKPEKSTRTEKQIFLDTLNIPPEGRAAYLDRVCGVSGALRDGVEGLLSSMGQMDRFLAAPSGTEGKAGTRGKAGTEAKSGDAAEGASIGRYHLIEKIGEGGFGTVWVAEQRTPLRRRVALKQLKASLPPNALARFDAERQALALMDHPNIARVLDGGTSEAGEAFFVMELVDGVSITQFCADQGSTLRERIALFVQVCEGVAHAHQAGVIHRDIKPSNVLVGVGVPPVVKIIDFGIAKPVTADIALTERPLQTTLGQIVGSPAHMAPEQLESRGITTRVDVYSLGVLLYELLTGVAPFDHAALMDELGYFEMLRRISSTDPERPSRRVDGRPAEWRRALHHELDWVVLRAMARDPDERYATVHDLRNDLLNFLEHRPVTVAAPGARQRATKFVRRHRLGVLATAAVGCTLVAGIVITTKFWLEAESLAIRERDANAAATLALENATRARDDANRARDAASSASRAAIAARDAEKSARTSAERRLQDAERVRHDLAITDTFYMELLGSTKPGNGGRDLTIRDAVDGVARRLEQGLHLNNPKRLAGFHRALGVIYMKRARLSLAEKHVRAATAARDSRTTKEGDLESELRLVIQRAWDQALLGKILRQRRDLPAAERVLLASLASLARIEANMATAETKQALGKVYFAQRRLPEALVELREALEMCRSLVDVSVRAASILGDMATVHVFRDEPVIGLRLCRDALREMESSSSASPHQLAGCRFDIGSMLVRASDCAAAVPYMETAVEELRQCCAENSESVASGLLGLASALHGSGQVIEAVKTAKEALAILRARFGLAHRGTMIAMNSVAGYLYDAGERVEGVALMQRALVAFDELPGVPADRIATTCSNLGHMMIDLDRAAEAQAYLERAVALHSTVFEDHHFELMGNRLQLARIYIDAKQSGRARDILAICEAAVGKTRRKSRFAFQIERTKIKLVFAAEDYLAAIAVCEACLGRLRSEPESSVNREVFVLLKLARAQRILLRHPAAEKSLRLVTKHLAAAASAEEPPRWLAARRRGLARERAESRTPR